MDLLQLTVLALNLATEHSAAAISVFVCDRIPGALSPLFGWIVFLLCVFHLDDIHFSSRRAGSDKLMSVCDGGICIFILLNKREMSSGALRILLCDRNHIIDWHTESCPSNSPWRARAASEENKGRFEADRVSGQTVSHCSGSGSLCVPANSQTFGAPAETMGKGIVLWNSKWERYSPFPSTADVIYVLLNCCVGRGSKSQAHCDKHVPRRLHGCCQASFTGGIKAQIHSVLVRRFQHRAFSFKVLLFVSWSPRLFQSKWIMTIFGIVSAMEGFTGIAFCLKVIRNIELPLRSSAVKQNLLVLQPETNRLTP